MSLLVLLFSLRSLCFGVQCPESCLFPFLIRISHVALCPVFLISPDLYHLLITIPAHLDYLLCLTCLFPPCSVFIDCCSIQSSPVHAVCRLCTVCLMTLPETLPVWFSNHCYFALLFLTCLSPVIIVRFVYQSPFGFMALRLYYLLLYYFWTLLTGGPNPKAEHHDELQPVFDESSEEIIMSRFAPGPQKSYGKRLCHHH